jgi:putative endonuclease
MPKKSWSIKRHGDHFVYILSCNDGSYYTGYTQDLEKRIKLHNQGRGARYVRGKGPVQLVFAKKYKYYKLAITAERKIKTKTRQQKKILIQEYCATTQ